MVGTAYYNNFTLMTGNQYTNANTVTIAFQQTTGGNVIWPSNRADDWVHYTHEDRSQNIYYQTWVHPDVARIQINGWITGGLQQCTQGRELTPEELKAWEAKRAKELVDRKEAYLRARKLIRELLSPVEVARIEAGLGVRVKSPKGDREFLVSAKTRVLVLDGDVPKEWWCVHPDQQGGIVPPIEETLVHLFLVRSGREDMLEKAANKTRFGQAKWEKDELDRISKEPAELPAPDKSLIGEVDELTVGNFGQVIGAGPQPMAVAEA